mgnify:CR=1 FL=1
MPYIQRGMVVGGEEAWQKLPIPAPFTVTPNGAACKRGKEIDEGFCSRTYFMRQGKYFHAASSGLVGFGLKLVPKMG